MQKKWKRNMFAGWLQQHSILLRMYIYIFENFGNSRFDKIIHIKLNIVGYIHSYDEHWNGE